MHQSEILVGAVARDRVAELRRHGTRRRPKRAGSVRRRTGWMLVDVGLRLALR
jgi:hypothetical protein